MAGRPRTPPDVKKRLPYTLIERVEGMIMLTFSEEDRLVLTPDQARAALPAFRSEVARVIEGLLITRR